MTGRYAEHSPIKSKRVGLGCKAPSTEGSMGANWERGVSYTTKQYQGTYGGDIWVSYLGIGGE